jgi:hypothetical protein
MTPTLQILLAVPLIFLSGYAIWRGVEWVFKAIWEHDVAQWRNSLKPGDDCFFVDTFGKQIIARVFRIEPDVVIVAWTHVDGLTSYHQKFRNELFPVRDFGADLNHPTQGLFGEGRQ